ncbi:MAG TPA: carbamate kinase [Tepidiformaceae bacterium]|nr:carbamate kinase [Tepidiformaceae bacterium]
MLIVAAVGGNALLRRGEPLTAGAQQRNALRAGRALAALATGHQLVITHGNGPQVGLLALESGTSGAAPAFPLDVLGAESQGMVGYLLELALRNELASRPVTTILGQVLVDPADTAFEHPSKPIGPFYSREACDRLAAANGWTFGFEGDRGRRLVPSPEPLEVLELDAIRALLGAGVVTISAGGGGVPVARDASGRLAGVEAVVDKDLTASLLARRLNAGALLLLTDVAAVHERWGDPASRTIRAATPGAIGEYEFAPGSMGPKAEAAIRFAEATGALAAIGALESASAILAGTAGTRISPREQGITFWEASE